MDRNIVAQFAGDSPFKFHIEKIEIETIEKSETSGRMIITGVASTTNVDHDSERMALPALERMANIINEKAVPLRVEHRKDDNSIIGRVFEATIDDAKKLIIKAELDPDSSTAKVLWDGLQAGAKMGFSVGGRVKSAIKEIAENVGKVVKTFYDVILDEVSVTPRPANFDAWLISHSFAKSLDETREYYGSSIYNTFLFENPQLDYLAAIEKSIPSKSWVKVDSNMSTNNMKIIKTSSSEGTTPAEEKAVESKDTTIESEPKTEEKAAETASTEPKEETAKYASVVYVDKKFSEVISLLKAIRKGIDATPSDHVPAVDQEMPTETKSAPDPEEMKDRTGQDTTSANGGEESERGEDTPAMDQRNGDVPKSRARKADPDRAAYHDPKAADELDQQGGKQDATYSDTSAADDLDQAGPDAAKDQSDSETGTDSREKTNSYGNEYLMPELQRALKTARFSKTNPLDAFVYFVTKHVDDMKDQLAKSNKRVLGLESRIAEMIRSNEPIQKTMKEWLRTPGQKRSVSLGVPYMVTRDGGRYELMAREVAIEKSQNLPADFKSAYKENFSSTARGEEIR